MDQKFEIDRKFGEGDIFKMNIQRAHFMTPFTTPGPDLTTTLGPNCDLLYRNAIWDGIQLIDAQDRQINYTKVHFINVWGAEDEGVKKMVAKLDSMRALCDEKMIILQNKSDSNEISPHEWSIVPVDWTTLEVLIKGWREMERFIEGKCAEKNLTKIEEDELYALREWLRFSDQEIAIPYDTMRERLEKIRASNNPHMLIPVTS